MKDVKDGFYVAPIVKENDTVEESVKTITVMGRWSKYNDGMQYEAPRQGTEISTFE